MPALYAHDPFLAVQRLLCAAWLDGPMAIASISCEGWAIALVAFAADTGLLGTDQRCHDQT